MFSPYSIEVTDEAEHKFLLGLLNARTCVPKSDCDDFSTELDEHFYKIVTEIN